MIEACNLDTDVKYIAKSGMYGTVFGDSITLWRLLAYPEVVLGGFRSATIWWRGVWRVA